MFNPTFNTIVLFLWQSVFFGGGNQSAQREPLTFGCCFNKTHEKHGKKAQEFELFKTEKLFD